MTRKTCNNTDVGVALESVYNNAYGYDHSRLRCRKTMAHQRFTRGNSKFLHIDDLYRSDSTITKLFLKINDIALNQTLNNLRRSSLPDESNKCTTMTRNKILRSHTAMYDKIKSPNNGDSCFQLRPRRHTSLINNVIDTSCDDDSNPINPRELRSTSKLLLARLKTPEPKVVNSNRPKRNIKSKRLSIEEHVVNPKNDLKVLGKRHRLRTKNNVKPKISHRKAAYSSDSEDDKAFLAMNKKKRESELTRLNNEAENFLFPKIKQEIVCADSENNTDYEDSSYLDSNNRCELVNGGIGNFNKSFKYTHEEESRDSTSSDTSSRRKKRRLTQAEAFILDNQQYYKFETPGSRLRYHGSYLSPLVVPSSTSKATATTTASTSHFFNKSNGDLLSLKVVEESARKVKKKYNLDRLQFSFESIPNCESWYETFQRQDTGQERYTSCFTSLSEERKIMLPYELGSIPPLNPRRCYNTYQELRKSFLGESPSSHTAMCSTPDSYSRDTSLKTDDISTGDDTRSSADFQLDTDATLNVTRQTRGSIGRIGASLKTPRKSPRQHASTLAILSSLIQQRRRKSKPILPAVEEENDSKPDYDDIATFLNTSLDCLDLIEEEPESIDCNVHCKPSAVCSLEEYLSEPRTPKSVYKIFSDRKTVRKKRPNKTGWPSKCKRLPFKKEGSNSSGSIIYSSTDSNSKNNEIKEDILNCVKTEVETKSKIDDDCAGYRTNCVNVDLAKWENAERLLTAKLRSDFQPVVRVQKLANNIIERRNQRVQCLRSKPSRSVSPKSPRRLRRPRNKFN